MTGDTLTVHYARSTKPEPNAAGLPSVRAPQPGLNCLCCWLQGTCEACGDDFTEPILRLYPGEGAMAQTTLRGTEQLCARNKAKPMMTCTMNNSVDLGNPQPGKGRSCEE